MKKIRLQILDKDKDLKIEGYTLLSDDEEKIMKDPRGTLREILINRLTKLVDVYLQKS
jgi:hypothetical protein